MVVAGRAGGGGGRGFGVVGRPAQAAVAAHHTSTSATGAPTPSDAGTRTWRASPAVMETKSSETLTLPGATNPLKGAGHGVGEGVRIHRLGPVPVEAGGQGLRAGLPAGGPRPRRGPP